MPPSCYSIGVAAHAGLGSVLVFDDTRVPVHFKPLHKRVVDGDDVGGNGGAMKQKRQLSGLMLRQQLSPIQRDRRAVLRTHVAARVVKLSPGSLTRKQEKKQPVAVEMSCV
jgi:hypothetical protein